MTSRNYFFKVSGAKWSHNGAIINEESLLSEASAGKSEMLISVTLPCEIDVVGVSGRCRIKKIDEESFPKRRREKNKVPRAIFSDF